VFWFPALCLVFGLPIVFLFPPFLSSDEIPHYYRVYQISEFRIGSDSRGFEGGGMLPASLSKTTDAVRENMFDVPGFTLAQMEDVPRLPLAPDDRVWTEFTGAALYSPVPYIPHAIGVLIGRIFSAAPLTLLYIARVCSLLTWAFMGALALRIVPFYRNVLFVILLTPLVFTKAATLNADVVTVGACALLFCQVLKMAFGDGGVARRDIVLLLGLAAVVGLSKIAYAPLAALCFIIPAERLGGGKRFLLICGGAVFIAFFVNLVWMGFLSLSLHLMADEIAQPGAQIRYMITRPHEFILVLWRYTIAHSWANIRAVFGEAIVWREVWLPIWVIFSLWGATLLAVLSDRYEAEISAFKRGGLLAVVLVGYAVIVASLYVSYTPLMATHVAGMQPRYMFPLLMPLLLVFKSSKFPKFNAFPLCLLVTAVSLANVLIAMHSRFAA